MAPQNRISRALMLKTTLGLRVRSLALWRANFSAVCRSSPHPTRPIWGVGDGPPEPNLARVDAENDLGVAGPLPGALEGELLGRLPFLAPPHASDLGSRRWPPRTESRAR